MATRSMSTISYSDVVILDEKLESLQLKRDSVVNNGDTLYNTVAHQLSFRGYNNSAGDILQGSINFLRNNRKIGNVDWTKAIDSGLTKEEYLLHRLQNDQLSDDVMLQAISSFLRYSIVVVTADDIIEVLPHEPQVGKLIVARINKGNYFSVEGNADFSKETVRHLTLHGDAPTKSILKNRTAGETRRPKVGFQSTGSESTDEETNLLHPNVSEITTDDNLDMDTFDDEEKPKENKVDLWDEFICEPQEDDSRTATNAMKFFTKAFKFFSYFIFSGAVVLSAFVSKASLMVLVNSAKPYEKPTDGNIRESSLVNHDVIRAWSYIIILVILLFSEVLTILYSLFRIIMKPEPVIQISTLLWGGLWELLHAFGEGILFLKVFPYLDSTYALLLLPLVAVIPTSIHIHAKYLSLKRNEKRDKTNVSKRRERLTNLILTGLALVLILVGLLTIFVPVIFGEAYLPFLLENYTYIWAACGILLTSVRYWENFVSTNLQLTKKKSPKISENGGDDLQKERKKVTKTLIGGYDLQKKLDNSRFQSSLVYALIKCIVLVGMAFLVMAVLENDTYASAYVNKSTSKWTGARYDRIVGLLSYNKGSTKNRNKILNMLWSVFGVQASCAFAAFFFGRVSCMTMIQRAAFTFPLVLVTPAVSACSAAVAVYDKIGGKNGLLGFFGFDDQLKGITDIYYYINWNNRMFSGATYDKLWCKNEESNVTCPTVMNSQIFAAVFVVIGLILGWLAFQFVTRFTWREPDEKLERMEVLFVKPLYGGPMIDQVLLLNRRQYESAYSQYRREKEEKEEKQRKSENEKHRRSTISRSDSIKRRNSLRRATISKGHRFTPQLFLCATMWHETEQEMTQILTSIMRMDKDHGTRKLNSQSDNDFYNFQVHILFDDAMITTENGKEIKTNKFVHQLCKLIPLAANKVELGKGYEIPYPVIYPTPYGGRLEYVMPNGNLMIIHLKDKQKIRHRKRWSQCMYMYYILGYMQAEKKAYKLENMFLLALDGDVDFQPNSVLLLMDRMRRNPLVGAVCGRIHPTGSGPVVWFQKFEYAIGHWLQKTAEHVLGCVLCSPGCFSLFRAEALVDVNVVNLYTTKATEARHYVQWDQGEDRWLCTLLLKQGWRIEYSAASDSYTFAPEDFNEFYNQRRRWGPSTMANIFDILLDAKLVVKNNIYVSWGYIVYQLGLMVSSLLGPATVVMIIQGAYQYVFSWSATVALIVSLIPVIIFIIICYTTKSKTQLIVANILTVFFALVMTAVVVGVIGGLVTNALLDPNNIFMIMLVGFYAFTGFVHPQEMTCLLHGILYYLCVPSAFILLMVYSLTNMNNVSWGTREVKQSAEEVNNQPAAKDAAGKKGWNRHIRFNPSSVHDEQISDEACYSCGFGNLCQCTLGGAPHTAYHAVPTQEVRTRQPTKNAHHRYPRTEGIQRSEIKKFSQAKAHISGMKPEDIERSLQKRMSLADFRRYSMKLHNQQSSLTTSRLRRVSTNRNRRMSRRSIQLHQDSLYDKDFPDENQLYDHIEDERESDQDFAADDQELQEESERKQEEDTEMLTWLLDGALTDGIINYLDDDERNFWKGLIEKYLAPLDEDKKEKDRIKSDLKNLRNRVTAAYYLLNSLWLILNFALQLTITDIAIVFYIGDDKVAVNPVSFLFLIFFLVILCIQFACMLMHRWSTALHLLSVTTLKWKDMRDAMKNESMADVENQANSHAQGAAGGKNTEKQKSKQTKKHTDTDVVELGITETPFEGKVNPVYDNLDEIKSKPFDGYDAEDEDYASIESDKESMRRIFDHNYPTSNQKFIPPGSPTTAKRMKSQEIDLEMFSDEEVGAGTSSGSSIVSTTAEVHFRGIDSERLDQTRNASVIAAPGEFGTTTL